MRQSKFNGAIAGLVPVVACIVACGNGNGGGESAWHLQEQRATSSTDGARLAVVSASVQTGHFVLPVPLGVERDQIAVGATGHVVVGKGARVTELSGKQFATVVGMDGVEVGEGAAVGNVYSMGAQPLALGQRATVNGFARTDSVLHRAPSSNVTVGVMEHANNQAEEYTFTVPFPSSNGPDQAVSARARVDMKAGSWGNLVVQAGGTVVLAAGAYYFESVDVEKNGGIEVDNSAGPVYLWVRSGLELSGTMVRYKSAPNVLVGYAGNAAPQIGTALDATLVAPAADVSLPATTQAHVGAIFAHSVALADGASLVHEAFQPGNADFGAAPDYSGCGSQCLEAYQIQVVECEDMENEASSACDSMGAECSVGGPSACAGVPVFAYGQCLSGYYAYCNYIQASCNSSAQASYQQCLSNAAAQYQQCGCN